MKLPFRGSVRVVIVVALIVTVVACGNGRSGYIQPQASVAFLRAVPSAGVSESAFFDELRQAGFVPGRNLRVFGSDPAAVHADPEVARAEIDRWRAEGVDLIMAFSTSGAVLARAGAPDADVLFVSSDPVAAGLVDDEAAPPDQVTGFAFRVPPDRLVDIARRALPHLEAMGLIYPSDDPVALANRDGLRAAADRFGVTLHDEPFDDEDGLRSAVAALADRGVDALVVTASPVITRLAASIREEADLHRLPVVGSVGVEDFAVVSLTPELEEMGRQLGRQAARLLSGTSAHAVPVESPRRFVLTINATAAAEVGLEIPDDVLREAQAVR
jgi:putative tryptophan/tyrosine transport system substrate-binding protein